MWRTLAVAVVLLIVGVEVMLARLETERRRSKGYPPRVVWGPTPIINIKYWSQSLKRYGFESMTIVHSVYPAFKREDFDRHFDSFEPRSPRLKFLTPYLVFLWCVRHADIFAFYFDGGYLANTPLRWFECQILKLAGKQTILMPFGADVAVPGTLGPVESAVYESYPHLKANGEEIRRRVLYFAHYADFVIGCLQPGFQPRHDLLWPNVSAIDTEQWKPIARDRGDDRDAQTAEVVIVHPTNHRPIKGTQILVQAVRELQDEGLRLRLDIIEGLSNEDVRAAMASADIIAEQFIAGFGLTAVEAMALGRPVLSNLYWLGPEFWDGTTLCDCPIVNTRPETLKVVLRRLATDPQLRSGLGRAGREYVLKFHSAEAVGAVWRSIIDHLWSGDPIPPKVSADFVSTSLARGGRSDSASRAVAFQKS